MVIDVFLLYKGSAIRAFLDHGGRPTSPGTFPKTMPAVMEHRE
jgi:hypothetical protein